MHPHERATLEQFDVPDLAPCLTALEVIGARELNPVVADTLRTRLLPSILSLLAGDEDASLEVRYAATEDGDVEVGLIVEEHGLDTPADLASAIGRVVSPAVELASIPLDPMCINEPRSRWYVGRRVPTGSIGFTEASSRRPDPVIADGFPFATVSELLEAVACSPGSTVEVRLGAAARIHSEPMPPFLVSISVTSTEILTAPPVMLASVVNRIVPGHSLRKEPGEFILGFADAGALPLIPVSAHPLPGLATAPAAPVPLRHLPQSRQPAGGVLLGRACTASGASIPAMLTEAERIRHVHVTGRTGTGKSTLLAGLAHSVAVRGEGLIVLDPHGTLVERIVSELPEDGLARTFVVRASDIENPVPVNPLSTEDPVARDVAIADILASFYTLFDPSRTGIIGPRFEQALAMCLRTLVALNGTRASLLDVPRLLTDQSFQRRARASVQDPVIRGYWENQDKARSSNEHGEIIAWITSKWERFTTTAALRAVLGSGQNTLDLDKVLSMNQIVLLDLSKGQIGETAAELLGFLHLSGIWTAALRRTDTTPFTVIVDEAHSFMAGSLPAMLAEGRKFGLSVVLAHQYLGQLPLELSRALSGNTATQIAFRAGRTDAEVLHERMGRMLPVETFTTLPDLTAVIQRTAGPTTAHPHTLTVQHLEDKAPPTRLKTLLAATAATLAPEPDLSAEPEPEREFTERVLPPRPAGLKPETPPKSFLDDWLEKRKQREEPEKPDDGVHGPVGPPYPRE